MGSFVDELEELEARRLELEAQIEAATPDKREDEDGEAAEEEEETEAVDEAQLKAWKKELTALKKEIKAKKDSLTAELNREVDGLDEAAAAELLLTILHHDMLGILDSYMTAQRQQIISSFERWWDKYKVTLKEIERSQSDATGQLNAFLEGLGYV
jgi:type I restriction enzyme M protein